MNEQDEDPARAAQAAEVPLPMLMTVKEALARLPCGKHWLLAHLRAWPLYHGKPTHRFAGRSIVFTPDDFRNLLESFPVRTRFGDRKHPFRPEVDIVPTRRANQERKAKAAPVPAPAPAPKPNGAKKSGRRGPRNYLKDRKGWTLANFDEFMAPPKG